MNSNTRTRQQPKKNYEGLYVSNLEEDVENDIFALHEAQTDSKTTKTGAPQRTSNRISTNGGLGNSRLLSTSKDESVKTSGVSRSLISNFNSKASPNTSNASTPTSQNVDKTQNDTITTSPSQRNSVQSTETTKRQTDAQKSDVGRQSSVTSTSVNQRKQVPAVQIAKRSHVTPRKMDVKGYGHETEDLVLQNLDEDF